jgi:serine/threonine protein kinase
MPVLIFESGHRKGERFVLPERGSLRIGRDPTCQVQLRDPMASRLHCVLNGEEGAWLLEDCQSSNGTWVNGKPARKHAMAVGDLLRIGDTVFSFFASAEDERIGRTIAGYLIEMRLGRGGMGTVYQARQLSLDRQVAVKILEPSFAADPAFVARFIREAHVAARLNHPNVVQIYDAGSDGTTYYLAMEYLSEGTLEDRLLSAGRLPYRDAISVAVDVLAALSFAEQQGIVHRDVKPANVLFVSDGTAKICDLGIAVDLRQHSHSQAGHAAGSPRYMAPEQALGRTVDNRADIYAVGATLYHTIAGVPPIEAGTVKELLAKKVKVDPLPLKQRVPEVPGSLSAAVATMLARDPSHRYACAADARAALLGPRRESTAPKKRPPALPPRRQKTFSGSIVAAVVVLVLVVGIAIVYSSRSRKGPEEHAAAPAAGTTEVKPSAISKPAAIEPGGREVREGPAKTPPRKAVVPVAPEAKAVPPAVPERVVAEPASKEGDHAGDTAAIAAKPAAGAATAATAEQDKPEPTPEPEGREETTKSPEEPAPPEPILRQTDVEECLSAMTSRLRKSLEDRHKPEISGEVMLIPDALAYEVAQQALERLTKGDDTEAVLKHVKKFLLGKRSQLQGKPRLEITIGCAAGHALFIPRGDLKNTFIAKYDAAKVSREILQKNQNPSYESWYAYLGRPGNPRKEAWTLWVIQRPLSVTLALGETWKGKSITVQVSGVLSTKELPPIGAYPTGLEGSQWEGFDAGRKHLQAFKHADLLVQPTVTFTPKEIEANSVALPAALKELLEETAPKKPSGEK